MVPPLSLEVSKTSPTETNPEMNKKQSALNCRFCQSSVTHTFANLGMSPLANAFVKAEHLSNMERFYPLHAYVCDQCFLVQLGEFESPEAIFSDYAYFSSYSDSWLSHAKNYTQQMTNRFKFDEQSLVVEVASNDGYLLQYFKEKNISVLGIEPAANVAKVAEEIGIPSLVEFFGTDCAQKLVAKGKQADLMIANNVLAHVPNINDFVAGFQLLLKPTGIATFEFPHLLQLIQHNQFDTIYHEHFSYLSLLTIQQVFAKQGLEVFDVEELPTHGGSLRVFVQQAEHQPHSVSNTVAELIETEKNAGLNQLNTYLRFSEQVKAVKYNLLSFLTEAKQQDKFIVGYAAAAKGNTLLNYCGIGPEFVDYVVDKNPYKQGRYLPGTHIPVKAPEAIQGTKPDYVLILAWNLQDEVKAQMDFIQDWGGQFLVPIPQLKILK